MNGASFEQGLELGHMGEALVAEWLKSRGAGVIPSYDFSGKHGEKSPRLVFESKKLLIPDLDFCRGGVRSWLEVKTYHGPAMNLRHGVLVHGIPGRLFRDYLDVERESACCVRLAVLELDSGCLLVSVLSTLLPLWKCTCPYCDLRGPGPCLVRIREGLYWPRSAMSLWHTFADADLRPIRERWPKAA